MLVRAAHHSDIVEIELSARKIPYVKFGGLRFTDTAHVKDFLATARILANPADDLAWFRLLRLHEGIGPVHARRVLAALPAGPGDPDGRDGPTVRRAWPTAGRGRSTPRRSGPGGPWPRRWTGSPIRPGTRAGRGRPERPGRWRRRRLRSWRSWTR